MVKSALKIIVSGTVQGVLFRQFTKDNADKLNLKGFVRNLEEGDLEVFIEGEKDNIDKILEIIRKGTPHSQIRNLKTEERNWTGEFKDFKVLRF